MSYDPTATPSAGRERPPASEDAVRPSDDSSKGLLRHVPRPLEPKMNTAAAHESYAARLDHDPQDEIPPPRHPSRQMMRWGPPPSEYGWEDREDRRPYGRPSHDYGPPGRAATATDYYGDEQYYPNRPYRRTPSVREPAPAARGPSQAHRRPRARPPQWEDPSEDESDEEPARRKRKSRAREDDSPPPSEIVYRLPFSNWMNSSFKNHFVAALGEFVGTTMFLFFAFAGTQVANAGAQTSDNTTTNQSTGFSPIVLMYIAVVFGFSLMVNVWIFFRISGGLFNPAVTLAMVMVGSIGYVRAALLLVSQIAGAIFSSYIVKVLFPTSFNVRTTLSSSTSVVSGVFIEAILTAELVFAIFMLAKEKHKATFMAPVGIGLALFVAELVGVYYTGGSLNPARSFGPCVVTGKFDSEHWIYWVGPAAGAIVAVAFYKFIKILEYEMANPGQDETTEEEAAAAAAGTPKKETV
ncbi:hypothetical protein LTR35_009727 [Friedmanniomyces endolithicus]|uniref:Aquaporin-like protein n=1 Tax=Friedmanniomyces endolithicus TaxID=329885 RepID=A0AAN6FN63_9PEZI|nr:hypothetical protein LTR35_009727 [Friedmanniomyces endolithicus]KAK0301067.1 hypothetical protein LTS00_000216 [Friedmanniomyces endolithicus]KAK0321345.1 hypothetical protein LTR82_007797 [Friedmanniomyces endolithicus]KAK1018855.1 hypothetical protein LTR54_000666 [Friedmanniomyces endolithicus]